MNMLVIRPVVTHLSGRSQQEITPVEKRWTSTLPLSSPAPFILVPTLRPVTYLDIELHGCKPDQCLCLTGITTKSRQPRRRQTSPTEPSLHRFNPFLCCCPHCALSLSFFPFPTTRALEAPADVTRGQVFLGVVATAVLTGEREG